MKFVAAYLLAFLSGNQSPSKDDVRKILDSVGAEVEEGKMEMLFKELEGKDINEVIAAGREKIAAVSSCAGAGAVVAGTAAVTGGAAAVEEEKEEKVEEEEEENMFSLFDD